MKLKKLGLHPPIGNVNFMIINDIAMIPELNFESNYLCSGYWQQDG